MLFAVAVPSFPYLVISNQLSLRCENNAPTAVTGEIMNAIGANAEVCLLEAGTVTLGRRFGSDTDRPVGELFGKDRVRNQAEAILISPTGALRVIRGGRASAIL